MGGLQHNTSFQQHHLHWSDMSFIHHAIAKKIKEDKESNKLEPEESPIKTVLDPDLDNIANPHEVKHWMDPRLIPFGWGMFDLDTDEVIVIEREPEILEVPVP